MGTKQRPRGAKKALPKAPRLIDLTSESLQEIFSLLEQTEDRKNLGKSCSLLYQVYKSMHKKIRVPNVLSLETIPYFNAALRARPSLTHIDATIYLSDPNRPSLDSIKHPKCESLTLDFFVHSPSRRSLSAIPNNFSSLSKLELGCSGAPRFDADSGLRVLSSLTKLKDLTLLTLGSDVNLNLLSSVTKLYVSFPPQSDDFPDELFCFGCRTLHVDEDHDLEVYKNSIKFENEVVLGSGIGRMPNLKDLTLDFRCPEESLDYTAALNRIKFYEPKKSAPKSSMESIHGLPGERVNFFENLEKITFYNAGGHEHFLYMQIMNRRLHFSGYCCLDMWHTCVIWEAYKSMPKLQKWRLFAYQGELNREEEERLVHWPCACGRGSVDGKIIEEYSGRDNEPHILLEINRPADLTVGGNNE